MDAFGYVYLAVDGGEMREIARGGLRSRPVNVEVDGETLVDGLYFSTSGDRALRGKDPSRTYLLRLNVDNISEITAVKEINASGKAVDYVAAGPAFFVIPPFEIDFRIARMPRWSAMDRFRMPRAEQPSKKTAAIAA
ncbi:MAG: hypothetical protein DI533_21635 [Cereibacter sphaeroides]|uniref:Uncharacterized protein n=1 Tax=Cereibacter sphaeroides TaxID=1063 RepID=A0A2W5RXY4_CERSP|nr:MAG: hypothetical protein DI533_21635 [Cereibacter sphaeroides]